MSLWRLREGSVSQSKDVSLLKGKITQILCKNVSLMLPIDSFQKDEEDTEHWNAACNKVFTSSQVTKLTRLISNARSAAIILSY